MDYNIIKKYSVREILERKELPEDIKLLAEQERKKYQEEFKNNKYWNGLPDDLKYYLSIGSVFTWQDFVKYLTEMEKESDDPIFPVYSDYQDHGIVNTEGQIGSLDPLPNADLPLRKGIKIPF